MQENRQPCTTYGARALEMTPGENLGLFCSTQDLTAKVNLERLTEKCRFSAVCQIEKTVTAIRKSVVRNPTKKLFSVSILKVGPTGDKTNTK